MAGTAIISFDCEGKWGVADHLTRELDTALSDKNLRWAYAEIFKLLDMYEISATFAFVGFFVRPPSAANIEAVCDIARELPYLQSAAEGLKDGHEGWVGDWALDGVGDGHEVAFHGATHVPWPLLTRAQAEREIEMTPAAQRRTMVFPRNQIAHLDVLESAGCAGYRARKMFRSRAHSLVSELDLWTKAEVPMPEGRRPCAIPAGVFVNWRNGPRRTIPPVVTRIRARRLLGDAVRTGGVAHFWLHPENLATAPSTLVNLASVAREIARFRDAGSIEVKTQFEYCSGMS
ncbi:MAG: polysaccharide deacetylase family protein [Parvibaculum sp.]|nr:polysaccharide deacetylase family protein [Parvibaculum sp.]